MPTTRGATPTTHSRARMWRLETEEVFRSAARAIVDFRKEVTEERIPIALPGGRTGVALLQALSSLVTEAHDLYRFEFFEASAFEPDEQRPKSNWQLLECAFFRQAVNDRLVRSEQLHPFPLSSDPEADIEHYQQELEQFGGRFDAVVLGAGGGTFGSEEEDPGHCAGLYPNESEVWSKKVPFVVCRNAPNHPAIRRTGTPWLFQQADLLIGIVAGEQNRKTVENYQNGLPATECPIALVDGGRGRSCFFTDILK